MKRLRAASRGFVAGCCTALIGGVLAAALLSACSTHLFSSSSRHSTTAAGAGAGAGVHSGGSQPGARGNAAAASVTSASPPEVVTTITTTNTTSTLTGSTSTTQTGTATTAALPGAHHPLIQLGDMNTNEQFIIGDLYDLALTHEGYTVVLSPNIGTTATSQAALAQGSLMLYPEYLNVWDTQVVNSKLQFTSLADAYAAGENYAVRHGWTLLHPTPFSDTSGIAVSAQYARLNDVYSLATLGDGPDITLGAPLEFAQARSGLPELEAEYGFKPAYVQSINIGDQYRALSQGAIQATYVSTTDPQLATGDYVLLRDPEHVFGFGNIVPVTTEKVISAEGLQFVATIDRVDALLTESAMRGLNYEVTIEHHDPMVVALEFLQGNGIVPPVNYVPVTTTTSTAATSAGAGGGAG